MQPALPGAKRLLIAWLILIGLTLLSLWSAQLDDGLRTAALPLWAITLVLCGAGYKVQQILLVYLNLRVSSAAWRGSFLSLLWLTILLIWLAYSMPSWR